MRLTHHNPFKGPYFLGKLVFEIAVAQQFRTRDRTFRPRKQILNFARQILEFVRQMFLDAQIKNQKSKLRAKFSSTPILKISSENIEKLKSRRVFGVVNFAVIAVFSP